MTQPSMSAEELSKLEELLELAKTTEHQMQELADFTLEINQKYEKLLAQFRVSQKLEANGID
ncbi:hypothetical protein H6G20_25650 [Desertifilum sp. FACHB-1129]|uniref:Uncharacterized protein n=2 Tax=Desertifilum tharense IPPAS B-1220 TaxID=1781255 RepID=A0A1E5QJT1_9CYAN|nr:MULTISPECIES: hypothetical protein [Desertifilum]MCD8487329.1 hypothetical protein [Desertifilum sp.]MDA0212562.1 hypothetical protein [Cyanobacteria bacterium FC1]MBD2315057.1 hypothetical protein [Desertifilum sp. FACHB-1129]MBD2324980.1 hypothetical protein [Desertifilum sp. FACHB-866]MBD2335119.1 hypothetical protein [Desertifilum sp. FACHB-868]